MPTTVERLFDEAAADYAGVVRWGEPIEVKVPGVYAVSLFTNPQALLQSLADFNPNQNAMAELLEVRPELKVDGERPTVTQLSKRLQECWVLLSGTTAGWASSAVATIASFSRVFRRNMESEFGLNEDSGRMTTELRSQETCQEPSRSLYSRRNQQATIALCTALTRPRNDV